MSQILRSRRELAGVRDEWNALADRHGHALLRHEWFMAAARTLHAEGDLFVIVWRDAGVVHAIAPLARRRVAAVERLELIGGEVLHEPGGFLYLNASSRASLLRDVFRAGRPVALQRLSAREIDSDLMATARGRGVAIAKGTGCSLAVDCGGDAATDRLPGKLRYDIRRARTRATEHGTVRFEVLEPGDRDSDALLDRFIAVETAGWKGRKGSSLAANFRLQAFFRTYCALAAAQGYLRVFFLSAGNRIAAGQIAVELYGRLWVLKIGYDEAFARCSPGFLLTAEAIAYANRRGLASYEFLGGVESWEERWRPERRPCGLVTFYPWNLRGCAGASVDVAGAAWRHLGGEASFGARR